jgi:hypothetical protein
MTSLTLEELSMLLSISIAPKHHQLHQAGMKQGANPNYHST